MSTNLTKRSRDNLPENADYRKVTASTPKNCDMAIVDLSGSMESIAFGGKSKYSCLSEALAPYYGRVQVLAFADNVREVDANHLPPIGFLGYSTHLDKAFKTAMTLKPLHILVVSDGCPNNTRNALELAETIASGDDGAIIDVIYIGPQDETAAISFMQRLAEIGRERFFNFEIDQKSPALLESKIGSLLALPDPESIKL